MRLRSGALLGIALLFALAGCGGTTPATSPSPSGSVTTPAATPTSSSTPTPTSPPTPTGPVLTPTVTVNGEIAVGVPAGWTVERSQIQLGSGSVCLAPAGSTQTVFGCAGIAIDFGKHLPGAHTDPYAADQPDGWYPATDVEPCPFIKNDGLDGHLVGMNTKAGVAKGLKPVGKHQADWNRWTASCAGRTFHPQAWFLPTSKIVIFDYLDHPQTASVLASTVFAKDGVTLPASATYLSAHLVSYSGGTMVVQPFHTYVNGPAAKAYAAAHGIGYPFPDDYYDADMGPKQTITVNSSTACVGGDSMNVAIGTPVPCSAFGQHPNITLPIAIWLIPGGSQTAESVTEIFRP